MTVTAVLSSPNPPLSASTSLLQSLFTMFRILLNGSRRCAFAGSLHIRALALCQATNSPGHVINQHTPSGFISVRKFSDDKISNDRKGRLLPPIMAFEEVIWPSVFKSIRSFIFVHFIIRPYLDDEFVVKDFTLGAKQAVHVISNKLANGDWDGLKGIVSEDVMPELRENLSKMTVAQRSQVAIAKDDIYLTFPYQVKDLLIISTTHLTNNVFPPQIGIIFDDESALKRIVEITMVFHTIKGLKEILNRGEQIPMNLKWVLFIAAFLSVTPN